MIGHQAIGGDADLGLGLGFGENPLKGGASLLEMVRIMNLLAGSGA